MIITDCASETLINISLHLSIIRSSTALVENVFLLLITASMKVALTAWTFGMMVPAGIFLPTIAIGACIGRGIGLAV